jgi:hypothetical protein
MVRLRIFKSDLFSASLMNGRVRAEDVGRLEGSIHEPSRPSEQGPESCWTARIGKAVRHNHAYICIAFTILFCDLCFEFRNDIWFHGILTRTFSLSASSLGVRVTRC